MRIYLLFALLIGAAIAAPKSITRIVGGQNTSIEEHPYMSNMNYLVWGIFWMQFCGGTLLTSSTVVSAAHCYVGDVASQWRVRLGSSMASSGGTIYQAGRLIIHPQYSDSTLIADVAVIVLSTPATLSNVVQPARIAGTNYHVPDGGIVTSIGWGALSSGGSSPEILQDVQVNVINQELCAERYAYLKTLPGYSGWPDITDGMLCAGILDVGGKDACQGDSGGPLIYDSNVLVGITSWGFGCAHEFYPGVNARVSYYSDWIVQNAST